MRYFAILYFKSTLFDKSDENLPPASIRLQRGVEQLNKLKKYKIKSFDQVEEKIQKMLDKQDYEQVVRILEENKNKLFYRDAMSLIGTNFYLKFMYGGKGLDNEIITKYEKNPQSIKTLIKKLKTSFRKQTNDLARFFRKK